MRLIMSAYPAYVLMAFLALINLTSANFDLYEVAVIVGHRKGGWRYWDAYMLFNDVATCEGNPREKFYYLESDDLSHGRLGVRCEGHCGYKDPPWPNVNLVAMHFSNTPNHHYTIYKDRGYQDGETWLWPIYGTDGKKHGNCFAYGGHHFNCDWSFDGRMRRAEGWRKFRCLTDLDSDRINEAARKEKGEILASVEDEVMGAALLGNSSTVARSA